jgi:hypothetical protein
MTSTVEELLDAIDRSLAGTTHPYTSAMKADRIYEAYVFCLVVDAAAEAGARVVFRNAMDQDVTDLVFRGAPGVLYARTGGWTHALVSFGQAPPLEIHLRVNLEGKSTKTDAECDVLIIEHHAAFESRRDGVSPKSSRCIGVVECKYYSGQLPPGLAREFAQLCNDRGKPHVGFFVSNQFAAMAGKILATVGNARWEFEVLPGRRQQPHLMSLLREVFKHWVAPYDPDHRM